MKPEQHIFKKHHQTSTERRSGWKLLCLFFAVALTGCSHPRPAGAEPAPTGTYALVSVDGKAVPCPLTHDGHTLLIKSGSFTFTPTNTCVSKMVFSPPSGTEATKEVKASYTQQGSKLTMRWERAGVTTGTLEGNTFTMKNEGMVLQYRK